MKSNELRIGNWVTESGISSRDRALQGPYQVEVRDLLYSQFLEPIPLSEEILLKIGFIKNEEHSQMLYGIYDHFHFDFRVEVLNGAWEYCINEGTKNIKLQYLHQLQNLFFALTNQELEIIL